MPLGLPDSVQACLFDLDGVLTRTAEVHAAAWKQVFDEFLRRRAAATGTPFVPFDAVSEYDAYVDGRPRADGTRAFLASRGVVLDEGRPDDAEPDTIAGISRRKQELFLALVDRDGVRTYSGSVRYVKAVRKAGLARAVVSSSANSQAILAAARIGDLFDARVDGLTAASEGLAGKPAPDTFLAAARMLGVEAKACAVFEDAQAGVAAGRAGGFAWVVGVDRSGQAEDLLRRGAHVVVADLGELLER